MGGAVYEWARRIFDSSGFPLARNNVGPAESGIGQRGSRTGGQLAFGLLRLLPRDNHEYEAQAWLLFAISYLAIKRDTRSGSRPGPEATMVAIPAGGGPGTPVGTQGTALRPMVARIPDCAQFDTCNCCCKHPPKIQTWAHAV